MPKQVPKQCRWCEYTAGNGGALSSHAKTKHPGEWEAFKAEQATAQPSQRQSLSTTAPPEEVPMLGFRFGVRFDIEVAEEDQSRWQEIADQVRQLMVDGMAVLFRHSAEVPDGVILTDVAPPRSMLYPQKTLRQKGN